MPAVINSRHNRVAGLTGQTNHEEEIEFAAAQIQRPFYVRFYSRIVVLFPHYRSYLLVMSIRGDFEVEIINRVGHNLEIFLWCGIK